MGAGLNCRECAGSLSDFRDGILPLGQFLRIRIHLFNCPACRSLLATLRALPGLVAQGLPREPGGEALAQLALAGALARLARPEEPRAWAATPVPEAAQDLLAGRPDLPLRVLAATHALITRERLPRPGGSLPQPILDQLPAPERWTWEEAANGSRKAGLLAEPMGGPRLSLVYAPPGSAFPPHQHLGSESILILDGSMADRGHEFARGGWAHHPEGSCHAPQVGPDGCRCLVREEGTVLLLGPAAWLASLGNAS